MNGDYGGEYGNGGTSSSVRKCRLTEQLVFLTALLCGTACSICSKTMMQLRGVGVTGEVETFTKPIFQTFGMFIGMLAGLVTHWLVLAFKIPFPGYDHAAAASTAATALKDPPKTCPPTPSPPPPSQPAALLPAATEKDLLLPGSGAGAGAAAVLYVNGGEEAEGAAEAEEERHFRRLADKSSSSGGNGPPNGGGSGGGATPIWMYFLLAIPSVFDLAATTFCMMGLVYLDVSIYQLLRGSGIVFVALMKHHALGDRLYAFQWVGVFLNVISVILVGATAMLNSSPSSSAAAAAAASGGEMAGLDAFVEGDDRARHVATTAEALLGVVLVLSGAFVQALQFVFEEKVMSLESEAAVPPLLLIGMEGLWGTILCLILVYPLAYFIPGDDHGSYEDPFNTWYMLIHTPTIRWSFFVYFLAILGYNLFAALVTFLLNSVWHAILDNFRPITVWATDMFIFYVIYASSTGAGFGEPWTQYSWIQLLGMFVLLYGTAIYNAPNAGSIQLHGRWYHMFINCDNEYANVDFDQSWRSCTSRRSALLGSVHSHM